MQAYKDLKLKCGDCDDTVSSAALLLQHFAQHITEQHETEHKSSIKREYSHSSSFFKKKKKNKSILESVLKIGDTSTVSEPSPLGATDSSTISAFSDYQESSSDNSSVLQTSLNSSESPKREENVLISDENIRLKCQPSLSLIRFDLQERLENCVMNLSNKKIETLNNNICESDKLEICKSIKKEKDEDRATEASTVGGTNEEFNPLKFCMITMEENKEFTVNKDNEFKKVSNRKQLIPKKIEQNMRKLAPKPNDVPKSRDNLNGKLSHKKKYPCHLCSKVFGWSTDLKRHILVHTGERPFKCKTCLASFTRNFLLQKHQSKVHPCSPPKKTPISISPTTKVVENSNTLNISKMEVQEQTVLPKIEKSESGDGIDEDEDRLVITESFQGEEINSFQNVFQNTIDSKWASVNSSTDRRCSDMEHSDMFSMGQMKVVTM